MTALDKAVALDTMEQDVTSWEAGFLESVLKCLRAGGSLSQKQADKLAELYDHYFDVKLNIESIDDEEES